LSQRAYEKDHDNVGPDYQDNFYSWETSEKSQIEEQQRCCNDPVHISGPVYLTEDELGRFILVVMDDIDEVERMASSCCHDEIRQTSRKGNQDGNVVKDSVMLLDTDCHEDKYETDDDEGCEDDPESLIQTGEMGNYNMTRLGRMFPHPMRNRMSRE
jgi:hypothetical protein